MTNWEKLATDIDLEAMWESPEMQKELHTHEVVLLRFNDKTSTERMAYQQGILRGLMIARIFPSKQRDLERNKTIEEVLEEQKGTRFAEGLRKFRSLRFGSV